MRLRDHGFLLLCLFAATVAIISAVGGTDYSCAMVIGGSAVVLIAYVLVFDYVESEYRREAETTLLTVRQTFEADRQRWLTERDRLIARTDHWRDIALASLSNEPETSVLPVVMKTNRLIILEEETINDRQGD